MNKKKTKKERTIQKIHYKTRENVFVGEVDWEQ